MMDFDKAVEIARAVVDIKDVDRVTTSETPQFRVTITEEDAVSNGHRFVVYVNEARNASAGCWDRFAETMKKLGDDVWWHPASASEDHGTRVMKVRA